MATVAAPKNDEEAAALERQLADYRAKRAREEYAARVERFAPLRAMVESDAYKQVAEEAAALADSFRDVDSVDVHLRHLPGFMTRLTEAVTSAVTPPAGLADAAEAAEEAPAT